MKSVLVGILLVLTPAVTAAQKLVPATDTGALPTVKVGQRVGQPPSVYDDGGRRDPFASLILPKPISAQAANNAPRARITGLASLSIADATVRGIVGNGKTMMAVVEGPNHQSFVIHPKDRLLDGSVLTIDDSGVVFEGPGPGGPTNRVRKTLHTAEVEQ
jgi:hypothetical protein